jgi:hypothetical protein
MATLVLVGVTACKDAVTSPQLGPEIRYGRSSFPPPPPEDQTATGAFVSTGTLSTNVVCSFSIPARFFYGPKEKNGWVHFENGEGVTASSNGMVTNKNGDFSGKGTLQIVTTCGLVVIDLSSVNDGSSFFCGFDQNCWHLFFDEALLYECGNTTDCTPIEGTANMEGGVFDD